MAALKSFFTKLSRPPEDIRAENLRHWASTVPGTTSISDVRPRQRTKVAGVIRNIRIDPRQGTGSIEATIMDGTGQMVAKWLGRSKMSGIRLGMGVVMEGVVGLDPEGDLMILNPDYRLVPGPEH